MFLPVEAYPEAVAREDRLESRSRFSLSCLSLVSPLFSLLSLSHTHYSLIQPPTPSPTFNLARSLRVPPQTTETLSFSSSTLDVLFCPEQRFHRGSKKTKQKTRGEGIHVVPAGWSLRRQRLFRGPCHDKKEYKISIRTPRTFFLHN